MGAAAEAFRAPTPARRCAVPQAPEIKFEPAVARQFGWALGSLAAQNLAVAVSDGCAVRGRRGQRKRCPQGGANAACLQAQQRRPTCACRPAAGLTPQDAKKNALKASAATWFTGAGLLAYNGYENNVRSGGWRLTTL